MWRLRRVGLSAAAAVVVLGLAGCGGGSDGGEGKAGAGGRSAPASSSAPAVPAPRDALADYQRQTASGCAGDCQGFMTRKLAAAVAVREAMEAKDRALYAVPIGLVEEAERRADHYGRDNLAARGNMAAVSGPLQEMVGWFREHPEG